MFHNNEMVKKNVSGYLSVNGLVKLHAFKSPNFKPFQNQSSVGENHENLPQNPENLLPNCLDLFLMVWSLVSWVLLLKLSS